jgi:16S rRNA (adenine1518-N6/adenine1519-N6)-dimethyltransferase
MNLPPLNVQALLHRYGLFPHKGLGQNFIVDQGALEKIIKTAEIPPETTVLEIGPGLGSLTRLLALSAMQVTAVELDRRLAPVLEDVLGDFQNINLYFGDILKINLEDLGLVPGYMVVANIPYYITSVVIRRLMESQIKPSRIVLTVQLEVADRICAQPNEMNLLALSVQVYGSPVKVAIIPAGSFFPSPKVDSAVIRIDLFPRPVILEANLDTYFTLIKAGFSQKRKTLRNALSAGLKISPADVANILEKCTIDPQRRAETLSLVEWVNLVQAFLRKS